MIPRGTKAQLQTAVALADFTEARLRGLRPGDRLNLADTLETFIGGGDAHVTHETNRVRTHPGDVDVLVKELWPALRDLRRLIGDVADRKDTKMIRVSITGLQLDARGLKAGAPPRSLFEVQGLRNLLLLRAWLELYASTAADRVRHCARRGCDHLFFAARSDQKFHAHPCANAASMAAFVKKQAEAKKKRSA